jgi:protein-S-isoprenylcysteine O-methyltransferase Ste14
MKNRALFLLLKSILFVILVPGTVAGFIPLVLLPHTDVTVDLIAVAGGLVIAPGLTILLVSVRDFWKTGKGTPAPIDPPKELVVVHLYRFMRNPMYTGVLSVLCGEAMMLRSVTHLIYALLVALGFFLFVLLYEEPALEKRFGPAYLDYCKRVPRWIPRMRGNQ